MKNGDMPASPVFNESGVPMHHSGGVIREGVCSGLTKRELFAAMAMQGLLASDLEAKFEVFAEVSVLQADALLAELEKSR